MRSRLRLRSRVELLDQCLADYEEYGDWPFRGTAASERMASEYLAGVFRGGRTGDEHAEYYTAEKALGGCKAMETHKLCLHVLDLMLTVDEVNVCNSAAAEALARYAYGLEVATEQVTCKGDWTDAKKSKAKWGLVRRYSTMDGLRTRRIAKADEPVRKELERETQQQKWLSKAGDAGLVEGPA